MSKKSSSFAKYRLPDVGPRAHYMSFSTLGDDQSPTKENHPLISQLDKCVPGGAKMLQTLMQTMIGYDTSMIVWLEDPANAELFMNDPLAALKQALPELPPSFYSELETLQDKY